MTNKNFTVSSEIFFGSERTKEEDYLVITDGFGSGCRSSVGKQGGRQYLWLSKDPINPEKNCLTDGKIVHELMHTFGFYHEHVRPDRDDYIKIKKENVKDYKVRRILFDIMKDSSTFNVDYDGQSIMHYSR